jgi:hypothetical protein
VNTDVNHVEDHGALSRGSDNNIPFCKSINVVRDLKNFRIKRTNGKDVRSRCGGYDASKHGQRLLPERIKVKIFE